MKYFPHQVLASSPRFWPGEFCTERKTKPFNVWYSTWAMYSLTCTVIMISDAEISTWQSYLPETNIKTLFNSGTRLTVRQFAARSVRETDDVPPTSRWQLMPLGLTKTRHHKFHELKASTYVMLEPESERKALHRYVYPFNFPFTSLCAFASSIVVGVWTKQNATYSLHELLLSLTFLHVWLNVNWRDTDNHAININFRAYSAH